MDESDLLEEFEKLEEPIVLKPYETCRYKDVCPYSNIDTSVPCFGTYENREWSFICDVKKLRGE